MDADSTPLEADPPPTLELLWPEPAQYDVDPVDASDPAEDLMAWLRCP